MAAVWHEDFDVGEPAPYLGLGDDEFTGWSPRPSAAARLFAFGLGLAVGVIVFSWFAGVVAGWVT